MYEILAKLNKVEGVNGSLIMGTDGLVVAADLGTEQDENAVAAVSSQIMASLTGALRRMRMGTFKRFVVTGRDGKIALMAADNVVVVALIDLDVNMGLVGVELKECVQEIRNKMRTM